MENVKKKAKVDYTKNRSAQGSSKAIEATTDRLRQLTLEVNSFDLFAPALGREKVLVSTKEPSTSQIGNTEARTLGSPLNRLATFFSIFARRCLGIFVLFPFFARNIVFPDRIR